VENISAYKIKAIRKDPESNPLFTLSAKPIGANHFGEDFFWCEDCGIYVYPDDFVDPAKFGESPYEWQLG
jgi:hypothetical protein